MKYVRIPESVLAEPDDNLLFQGVADHVLGLLGGKYPSSIEVLIDDLPQSVRAAWLLWGFSAEVAGNGLPDYLLNHCSSTVEAQAYLAALRAVRADALVEMFEACIPLALAEDSELLSFPGSDWFRSFPPPKRWQSLDAVAEPSMELTASPLSCLVAAHLRASAGEI